MAECPGMDLPGRGVPSSPAVAPSATLVPLMPGHAICQYTHAWQWPAWSCVLSLLHLIVFYEKRDQLLISKKNPKPTTKTKPKQKKPQTNGA